MLLGSPPDMIRGYPLRETGSAAHSGGQVRNPYSTTIPARWQQFFQSEWGKNGRARVPQGSGREAACGRGAH